MAFAAAVSLLETLRQLLVSNHQFSNSPNYPKSQIGILRNGVHSLANFLFDNPEIKSDFEIQIRDAIYEAEDAIESHLLKAEISQSFHGDLERVIRKINSIVEDTTKESNDSIFDRQIRPLSWRPDFDWSRKEYPLVGRDEDLIELKDRLMNGSEGLQVVPIVGIAGIGKTALARSVFEDPSVRKRFATRCWVKVPIEYRKRDVLLGLLGSMRKLGGRIRQKTDEQLAKDLSDSLKNKRYLVVLDDVRNFAVWNDLKEVFPDYYNGSLILLTARSTDEAPTSPHRLYSLSGEDTLALLEEIVFRKEPCPPQLAVMAKDIARSCRGFPLAVVMVGRLLTCAKLSAENWEIVWSSINNCGSCDNLTEALVSLTYKHLPQHLKSCLLYMAMFPYEYEIPVFKLIKLLIAEGFIQKSIALELLETYDVYNLQQLVHRGLVVLTFEGTLRIIEEVFHEFVVRKAKEEKFFLVINKDTNNDFFQENSTYNQQRRLCIQKNMHHFIKDLFEYNLNTSLSTVRSLLYTGLEHQHPLRSWLDFKLLRVLDALKIRFYTFPREILKLILLRYLALSYNGKLPAAVCKLRKLQVLIVLRYLCVKRSGTQSNLPVEIWNMEELYHLQVIGSDLPDISSNTNSLLVNLTTLSGVGARSCTPHILEKLRNLEKLGIRIESPLENESSLSILSQLEILHKLRRFKCVVMYPDMGSHQFVHSSIPVFPSNLIKLTLSGCGFPWEYMRAIALLPNLEVLKLRSYAFQGPKWEVEEDEFPWLNSLLLEDMDLENWISADGSFPMLESLTIRHCYKLQEIPLKFVDIMDFEMIEVEDCRASVMDSAQQIDNRPKDSESRQIQVDLYSSLNDKNFKTFGSS